MPQIIKQNPVPDFRNLGVTLRIVLLANGCALTFALAKSNNWAEWPDRMLAIAALFEPVLLTSLLLLSLLQPVLERAGKQARWVIGALPAGVTLALVYYGGPLYTSATPAGFATFRYALLAALTSAALLAYLNLRARTLSPALEQARLLALHARIRPHFLFNTLNAVLGIVRNQPKQAETALEDLADLFRMAMADPRQFVPLPREIQLARDYLALEKLRLGERLQVEWVLDELPPEAVIPPLLLQPLLENAVYHGIEPMPEGGTIRIAMRSSKDLLHLEIENPYPAHAEPHSGNHMALANIQERLDLLFDVEARCTLEQRDGRYRVHIAYPYRPRATP